MKLIDYILGSRRGREANKMERDAMKDPFLADAMEGYDSVYGNHSDKLTELEQMVADKASRKQLPAWRSRNVVLAVVGAAAVLAVAVIIIRGSFGERNMNSGEYIAAVTEDNFVAPDATPVEREDVVAVRDDVAGTADMLSVVDNSVISELKVADYEEDQVASDGSVSETAVGAKQRSAMLASADVTESLQQDSVDAGEHINPAVVRSNTSPVSSGDIVCEDGTTLAAMVAADAGEIRIIRNAEFERYFAENHRSVDFSGRKLTGTVTAEFRVNDAGVPTSIRIVSGISSDANRKVIELLVSGPSWEPTGDERIRTVLKY